MSKRHRNRKSVIWSYFIDAGDNRGQCKVCKAFLSCHPASTSNLRKHITRKHPGLRTDGTLGEFSEAAEFIDVTENRNEESNVEEEEINIQETRNCLSQLVNDLGDLETDPPPKRKNPVASPKFSTVTTSSLHQQLTIPTIDVISVFKELSKLINDTVQFGMSNASKNMEKSNITNDTDECGLITKHIYMQLKQFPEENLLQASMEIQQILTKHRLNIRKKQAVMSQNVDHTTNNRSCMKPLNNNQILINEEVNVHNAVSEITESSGNDEVTIVVEGVHSIEDFTDEEKQEGSV